MRTKLSLFCAILLTILLSGCRSAAQAAATLPAESMKGYELYSWQEGGQWKFSLLIGTNREKTLEEIQAGGTVLDGVEALRSVLGNISPGQTVSWSTKESLPFPPDEILSQVEQMSKDQGLILNIAR